MRYFFKNMTRLFVLFVVGVLGPGSAFAEEYYWEFKPFNVRASNPNTACELVVQHEVSLGSTITNTPRVSPTSLPNVYNCIYSYRNKDDNGYNATVPLTLRGNACPPGTTYDPTIVNGSDQCVAPESEKCEPTIGQIVEHRHRAGEFTGMGQIGGRSDPPGSVCRNQCQYVFNFKPVRSYRFDGGDPAGVFIVYEYAGNGVSCTGNESGFTEPSDGFPTAENQSECTNKVVHADGSQSYDCQAIELKIEPGNLDCSVGEVGGVLDCYGKKPTPSLTENKVDQEIVEKPNPDGSSTTTTTTTTIEKKCIGTNACSTSTTTNVHNSKTNADGTPGGESTTCKGAGCKGEGQSEEQSEESKREATVGECKAPIACSGDAIDCAILQQQKEQRCLAEEMSDYAGKKSDIEGLFEGEQFDLQEGQGDIEIPSLIRQGTRFLPATCPQEKSFNLRTAGGRTFAFSFEPLCQAASDLSGLFVAVATILAALYVGRSVGGN